MFGAGRRSYTSTLCAPVLRRVQMAVAADTCKNLISKPRRPLAPGSSIR